MKNFFGINLSRERRSRNLQLCGIRRHEDARAGETPGQAMRKSAAGTRKLEPLAGAGMEAPPERNPFSYSVQTLSRKSKGVRT